MKKLYFINYLIIIIKFISLAYFDFQTKFKILSLLFYFVKNLKLLALKIFFILSKQIFAI